MYIHALVLLLVGLLLGGCGSDNTTVTDYSPGPPSAANNQLVSRNLPFPPEGVPATLSSSGSGYFVEFATGSWAAEVAASGRSGLPLGDLRHGSTDLSNLPVTGVTVENGRITMALGATVSSSSALPPPAASPAFLGLARVGATNAASATMAARGYRIQFSGQQAQVQVLLSASDAASLQSDFNNSNTRVLLAADSFVFFGRTFTLGNVVVGSGSSGGSLLVPQDLLYDTGDTVGANLSPQPIQNGVQPMLFQLALTGGRLVIGQTTELVSAAGSFQLTVPALDLNVVTVPGSFSTSLNLVQNGQEQRNVISGGIGSPGYFDLAPPANPPNVVTLNTQPFSFPVSISGTSALPTGAYQTFVVALTK